MYLKQAIENINGLKYMTDLLNVRSSAGRRHLYNLPFMSAIHDLEQTMANNALFYSKFTERQHTDDFSMLTSKLGQLRDIKTTLTHLAGKNVANDVELFEIKYFSILSEAIRQLVDKIDIPYIKLPNLLPVIDVLDPEKKRIPHFHIYDQYSEQLTDIRRKIKASEGAEKEQLLLEAEQIEDDIREGLSQQLSIFKDELIEALDLLAFLDVLLAKTEQAVAMALVKPEFSNQKTVLKAMYHPQVSEALEQKGKTFQCIDLDIPKEPTLITGANMAGKSVLLKTVALIQTLAQFGFYVPSASATIVPVDKVLVSVGDGQDAMNGLSSYASEMLEVNAMLQQVKKGERILVLIDELARTTNPIEGQAIVCGVLQFLIEHSVQSLITTHYTINLACRKLRVKGFKDVSDTYAINSDNINNFVDYTLEETSDNEVPHEALRIAEIIGVDNELIKKMHTFVKG